MSDTIRRSRWVWLAIALLVLSGSGIWNGWDEWPGAEDGAQKLASITEVGYGVLGLIGALAIYWGWAGTRLLLWIWTFCLGVTAGLAPVVWGGSPLWIGILCGVGAGLLGVWIVWMSTRTIKAT